MLFRSDYEKKQASSTVTSKPTNMETIDKPVSEETDDLDSLVADLDKDL